MFTVWHAHTKLWSGWVFSSQSFIYYTNTTLLFLLFPPLPSSHLPLSITQHKLTQNTQCDCIGYILSQRCVRSLTRIHPHHPHSLPLPSPPLPSSHLPLPITHHKLTQNTQCDCIGYILSQRRVRSLTRIHHHHPPSPPFPSPPLPSPPHYTPQTYTKHSVWLYRLHFVPALCS